MSRPAESPSVGPDGSRHEEEAETTLRTGRAPQQRSADDRLSRGQSVGRYVILGVAGEGGNGVVYRGYDPELDRRVAIKVLAGTSDDDGQTRKARVLQEARALARLSHPNVISVFDVGMHDEHVFVAMEFVDGVDLSAWVGATKPHFGGVARVLAQVARGLQAAHAADLIHRDLKPGNVLVADDEVYVVDFGLAQRRAADSGPQTEASDATARGDGTLPPGTPAYLAPELYVGEPATAKSDVYALCVTAWEAWFGTRPWSAATEVALVEAKAAGPPALPSAPRLPSRLTSVLRRGLSPSPAQRPGLDEILTALEPRPAWRHPAIAAVLVVGLGGAVAAVALTNADPCGGGPQRTAQVWSEPTQRAVQTGLTNSGSVLATGTWDRLVPGVDAFVSRWEQEYREACAATHERHEQSAALLDRRMGCLDRRLGQLGQLLTLLEQASPELVVAAPRALAKLDPVRGCERSRLADADPEPQTPGAQAVRADLDRVEVLEAAAQYDEGLTLARQCSDDAHTEGADGLRVEADYRVGRLLDLTGDHDAALEALTKAHWDAEAGGLDLLAAQAAVYVVYELAAVAHDSDEALAWEPHARAAIERAGGDPLEHAALIDNIGVAQLYAQRHDEALERFEQGLRMREEALGGDGLPVVGSLNNLGIVYEEMGRYDDAIAVHERAKAIVEGIVGTEHPHAARSHDNLGTAYLRKGDVATAMEFFGRALEIRRTVFGPDHRKVALTRAHIAAASLHAGRPVQAIEHYEDALRIYTATHGADSSYAMMVYEGLAHAHAAQSQWDSAHRYAKKALDGLLPKLGDEHPEIKGLREILAKPKVDG